MKGIFPPKHYERQSLIKWQIKDRIEWMAESRCFLKSINPRAELIGRHCSAILFRMMQQLLIVGMDGNFSPKSLTYEKWHTLQEIKLWCDEGFCAEFESRNRVLGGELPAACAARTTRVVFEQNNASECDASEATSRTVTHWRCLRQSISSRVVQIKATPLIILFFGKQTTCMHLTPLVAAKSRTFVWFHWRKKVEPWDVFKNSHGFFSASRMSLGQI